jgi:stage II sporulation protein AA (anti-sigma F factor antagonist)
MTREVDEDVSSAQDVYDVRLSASGSLTPRSGVDVPVDEIFRVSTVTVDGEAVVVVAGEIDLDAKARLQQVIEAVQAEGRRLVIDLSETTFIDSVGLHVLVTAWEAQKRTGSEMVLRAPSRVVQATMKIAGLWELLPVETTFDGSA